MGKNSRSRGNGNRKPPRVRSTRELGHGKSVRPLNPADCAIKRFYNGDKFLTKITVIERHREGGRKVEQGLREI